MAVDLSRVKERQALPARREPHWQRLRPGCFLGYRQSAREGAGTWIARAYDEDSRKYRIKALGDFGTLPVREQFAAAKKDAEAFANQVETGGVVKVETVEEACRRYAKANTEAEGRFKRYVYGDPLAKVKLDKLRRRHLLEWRERLETTPALVSRNKGDTTTTRPRAPSTVNRDMAVLRAALNKVLAPGAPDTEAAWQEALKPIRNADKQRTVYLDRKERKALLEACEAEARPFVEALCLLPLRPGAMAQLTVGDFDKRTGELSIGKDKSGKPRRILLPQGAKALFTKQAKSKLPAAHLFTRSNGAAWDKETWKHPIAAAVKAAGLPKAATTYTLRHSTITDLVRSGLPILTVAQISDTSVEMIERHYGHLNMPDAAAALEGLAL